MPQAGFTPIQNYNSPTAGHIPVNTDLYAGELAINTTDEKLYFKNTGGTVKLLASTAVFTTTGTGSYVLATSPTITGHPTIEGVTSTGATGTGKFVFDSAPTITGHPTIEGVTSTGATGTGKFVFDSAPTITGHPTIEGVTSTGATGTGKFVFDSSPTLSGVTLSDGTANGVAYLNSSKVLTSGSGLVFDGTNFGVNGPIATSTTQNTDGQIRISNTTTRAAGNKYGIRFADNTFETNASIYVEQGGSGSNAASLIFGVNAGTGGINLTSGTEQMRLTSTGLGIGTTSPAYKLDVVGTMGVSGAVTLSGGTANGVAYLNSSKVLTSGSALTFNGTNLVVAGSDISLDNAKAINFKASGGAYGNVLSVNSSNQVLFGDLTTSASAMVLSSGNLGLGVTPSAWSVLKAYDVSGGALGASSGSISVSHNGYYNGTNWIYKNTGYAVRYEQLAGNGGTSSHAWFIAPSGTAGNAISFTQAMTLDASGNLLVGTTSASGKLTVVGKIYNNFSGSSTSYTQTDGTMASFVRDNFGGYGCGIAILNGGNVNVGTGSFIDFGDVTTPSKGQILYVNKSGGSGDSMNFTVNSAIRMTLDASGNLLVGTTSGSYKITCNGQPGANGYTAWTNYSDERLKENIVDFVSEPVLGKMCELRPVSFNYNAKTGFDEETRKRTVSGFLAHEMQQVFPDMVGKTIIGEEEYLDTNLSNLTLYLVKAIQELVARIEKLENKL